MKELYQVDRWIQYKLAQASNRLNKIPCDVKGYAINPMDSLNWKQYAQIASEYKGFVLNGDGIVCLDLDGFLVAPGVTQRTFYQQFSNHLMEKSVSGKGLHIWFKTDYKLNHVLHDIGVELYTSNRFIALGIENNGKPLQFVSASALGEMFAPLLKTETVSTVKPTVSTVDTQTLLYRVVNGNYGQFHAKRIAGDLSLDNNDWSMCLWRLLKAMAYHSNKNVTLMYQTILTCEKLLALRNEKRYTKQVNGIDFLLYECEQACK